MKKTTQKRNTGAMVLSYLLSLLLVVAAAASMLIMTVCNRGYLKKQVLESSFADEVLSELNENYISYGAAGGLSREVMTGFVDRETIQNDMLRSADHFYDGNRNALTYPEISEAALAAFTEAAEEMDVEVTEEIHQGLQDLANGCQIDYQHYVRIPFVSLLAPLFHKVEKPAWIFFGVSWAVVVVTLILLGVKCRRSGGFLRYSIYAFSSAALLCGVAGAALPGILRLNRLNISPESTKVLIVDYANGIFGTLGYMCLFYAIVVAALAVTLGLARSRFLRRQYEEGNR